MKYLRLGMAALVGLTTAGCLQQAAVAPVAPVAALVQPGKGDVPAEKADPPAAPGAEAFRFTDDRGGQLLSTLLPPADRHKVVTPSAGPRTFAPLKSLEQPEVPLSAVPSGPPSVPARQTPSLLPRHVGEESPLTATRVKLATPDVQPLTTGPLVRTASAPVEQPAAVPYLAAPTVDRASLEDPTRDASLAGALSAVVPDRPGPAPFVRVPSADPFENRETVKVRTPLGEAPVPASGSSRTPQKN